MRYVDLVIDNKSEKTDQFYTYGCEDDSVRPGSKVYVSFGQGSALRDAYVFGVRDSLDSEIKNLKYVEKTDPEVSLTEEMISTCVWMKRRYLCKYIDAVRCFIPVGRKSARGKERNPFAEAEGEKQDIEKLTDEQEKALEKIGGAIDAGENRMFLLRGVTGSGKTEVYMQAIARTLEKGRKAIMLVPEISLTKQIIDRFIGRFGAENVAVLHSRLSDGERHDEWMRIRNGRVKIVIGARSAVFAPLDDIGIIVMDEEHETTYKSDMTPKYETSEVAIKRLKEHSGVFLMGSATPSVVSWNRACEGIYEKLELTERYNKVRLPDVEVTDMREELKSGNTGMFSRKLRRGIEDTLAEGRQVILFLNRRGYSSFVSCRECGEVIKCPDCGISMTYHKGEKRLICHYCGRTVRVPDKCPACGSRYIKYFGSGTEQIEEAAKELFKGYSIGRLDFDTVRKKGSLEKIIDRFSAGETDILIGTQLVAKGLDFRNVGLVGIMSADTSLNIPDFRSPERTFQLITQASGRAGRGDEKGKVIIQTYSPANYAVKAAAAQDYDAFYADEIKLREFMNYPPYSDLIQVMFTSKSGDAARYWGRKWTEALKGLLPEDTQNIFDLQEAPMAKIKDSSRYFFLVKCPRGSRATYMGALDHLKKNLVPDSRPVCRIGIDINPSSFM